MLLCWRIDPRNGSYLEKSSGIPDTIQFVDHPNTLATAIKIGSPVSWKKAIRAVIESHGQVISVTEQEIADAKAVIGRDGSAANLHPPRR